MTNNKTYSLPKGRKQRIEFLHSILRGNGTISDLSFDEDFKYVMNLNPTPEQREEFKKRAAENTDPKKLFFTLNLEK